MNGRLRVGDRLPALEFVDHTGATWTPTSVEGRPLVAILHRHLA